MKRLLPLFLLPVFAVAQPAPLSRLENSPRHHEWVEVKHGERTVQTFVAYPQNKNKAASVILIHENRGLTDWVRAVADQLAENGYIALAPDFLSGAAPGGGRTKDFASSDEAREAIGKLQPATVVADLNAVADYAKGLPAADGRLAVAGFCWGGTQTWRFAFVRSDLSQAFVFYGTAPDTPEAFAGIGAAVYGFYGGNDARVNATIERTTAAMTAAGKSFEPVVYDGAGHAYMRLGEVENATAPNKEAMEKSWARWLELLNAMKPVEQRPRVVSNMAPSGQTVRAAPEFCF